MRDGAIMGDVAYSVGVVLIPLHRHTIFLHNRILVPIQARINPQTKHMLMERRHDAFVYVRSKWHAHARIDGAGGEDAGCLDLVVQAGSLVEVPHEYVLVVTDCDYGLEDEDAGTGYGDVAGAGV